MVVKANIMEKKKIKNKSLKKVDLTKLADKVDIIILSDKFNGKGTEHNVTKDMAIVLINKGAAKLK